MNSFCNNTSLALFLGIHLFPIANNISRIDAVTSDEILRVANTYFRTERRTVGWVLPEHPEKERQTIIIPDEPLSPVPTEMVF